MSDMILVERVMILVLIGLAGAIFFVCKRPATEIREDTEDGET